MELASLNSDMALACEIKHDDKLTDEDGVYIQVIFVEQVKKHLFPNFDIVMLFMLLFFSNFFFLKPGSAAVHFLFWTEEIKNMQYVTEW